MGGTGAGAGRALRPEGKAAAWTTFAVGVAITLALAGAALYEQFVRDEPAGTWAPATIKSERGTHRGEHVYVPFTVANEGGDPAAGVEVASEVKDGETILEDATGDVAFLPVEGPTSGELVAAYDPVAHDIAARVGTLQTP